MFNNLGSMSLYLISMANIARFLGFSLSGCILFTKTTFFKFFCLLWCWKRHFLLLFVSFGVGNDAFGFFLFVGEVETLFRIAFDFIGRVETVFLSFR